MDAIKILFAFSLLLVPCIVFNNKTWIWVWTSIALVIGLWEIWSVFFSKEKKTISKKFWAWKDQAQTYAKVIVGTGYIAFFGYLFCHLFFRW